MTSRRQLIKTTAGIAVAGGGLLGMGVGATPRPGGPDLAGLDFADTLAMLTDGDTTPAGDDVQLDVPSFVSNGAFVPVTLRSALPDIDIIHLLIDKHPVSHVASMRPGSSVAYLSLSIRIARACNVTTLVSTPDGWLRADSGIENVQIGCEI